MATTAALQVRTNALLQGSSSRTRSGTVGTGIAILFECKEPAAQVVLSNQDATAANTLAVAVNDAAVTVATGLLIYGATNPVSIPLVQGDILYAVAAADRAIVAQGTPIY